MKKTSLKKLVDIYTAIGGLCSESEDAFHGFYKGGTEKLMSDFESVLKECGVKFAEDDNRYYIVSYMARTGSDYKKRGYEPVKEWGICSDKNDPANSWCLTGFSSPEEAQEVLNDTNIFKDYDGTPAEICDLVK